MEEARKKMRLCKEGGQRLGQTVPFSLPTGSMDPCDGQGTKCLMYWEGKLCGSGFRPSDWRIARELTSGQADARLICTIRLKAKTLI